MITLIVYSILTLGALAATAVVDANRQTSAPVRSKKAPA